MIRNCVRDCVNKTSMLPSVLFAIICLSMCTPNVNSTSMQWNRASANFEHRKKQATQRDVDSGCLDCICKEESNCNHNQPCKFDANGEACGAYLIHKNCFQDCCAFLGMSNCDSDSAWRTCAQDYTCATRCVTAYVNHYGPACSGELYPTCETFSRVYHGGPQGCNNPNTTEYWNDIKRCYSDHNPYLYPCTNDTDCTNSEHVCFNADSGWGGSDPNGWFCYCHSSEECVSNIDCCSNICQTNGTCQIGGGGAGTVCMWIDGANFGCAPGCRCIPFNNYGYCECN